MSFGWSSAVPRAGEAVRMVGRALSGRRSRDSQPNTGTTGANSSSTDESPRDIRQPFSPRIPSLLRGRAQWRARAESTTSPSSPGFLPPVAGPTSPASSSNSPLSPLGSWCAGTKPAVSSTCGRDHTSTTLSSEDLDRFRTGKSPSSSPAAGGSQFDGVGVTSSPLPSRIRNLAPLQKRIAATVAAALDSGDEAALDVSGASKQRSSPRNGLAESRGWESERLQGPRAHTLDARCFSSEPIAPAPGAHVERSAEGDTGAPATGCDALAGNLKAPTRGFSSTSFGSDSVNSNESVVAPMISSLPGMGESVPGAGSLGDKLVLANRQPSEEVELNQCSQLASCDARPRGARGSVCSVGHLNSMGSTCSTATGAPGCRVDEEDRYGQVYSTTTESQSQSLQSSSSSRDPCAISGAASGPGSPTKSGAPRYAPLVEGPDPPAERFEPAGDPSPLTGDQPLGAGDPSPGVSDTAPGRSGTGKTISRDSSQEWQSTSSRRQSFLQRRPSSLSVPGQPTRRNSTRSDRDPKIFPRHSSEGEQSDDDFQPTAWADVARWGGDMNRRSDDTAGPPRRPSLLGVPSRNSSRASSRRSTLSSRRSTLSALLEEPSVTTSPSNMSQQEFTSMVSLALEEAREKENNKDDTQSNCSSHDSRAKARDAPRRPSLPNGAKSREQAPRRPSLLSKAATAPIAQDGENDGEDSDSDSDDDTSENPAPELSSQVSKVLAKQQTAPMAGRFGSRISVSHEIPLATSSCGTHRISLSCEAPPLPDKMPIFGNLKSAARSDAESEGTGVSERADLPAKEIRTVAIEGDLEAHGEGPVDQSPKMPADLRVGDHGTPPPRRKPRNVPASESEEFMNKLFNKLEREAVMREERDDDVESASSPSTRSLHTTANSSRRTSNSCATSRRSSRSIGFAIPEASFVPMPSPNLMNSVDASPRISRHGTPRHSATFNLQDLGAISQRRTHSRSAGSQSRDDPSSPDASPRYHRSPSDAPSARSGNSHDDSGLTSSVNSRRASRGVETPDAWGRVFSLELDFTEGETIGVGSYGRVFAARHKTSGQIVAVKEILFERKEKDEGREPKVIDRECRLCEQLRHQCIVRYFGHELGEQDNGRGVNRLRLFLEYCSGGSVHSHLRNFGPLEAPLVARYGRQVLEGLRYLHSRDPAVVHRDLKCANLLLTHDANVKITDFGCSKWLQEEKGKQDTVVGSVFWSAPEVLLGNLETTTAVDMWGFSCCILEMATGQHPWAERKIDNVFQACRLVMNVEEMPAVPQELPPEIRAAIGACLIRDPAARASATGLRALPLFAEPE